MNYFIVLLEGNKEVCSVQVEGKGAVKFKNEVRERERPWEDDKERRSVDVSAKLC